MQSGVRGNSTSLWSLRAHLAPALQSVSAHGLRMCWSKGQAAWAALAGAQDEGFPLRLLQPWPGADRTRQASMQRGQLRWRLQASPGQAAPAACRLWCLRPCFRLAGSVLCSLHLPQWSTNSPRWSWSARCAAALPISCTAWQKHMSPALVAAACAPLRPPLHKPAPAPGCCLKPSTEAHGGKQAALDRDWAEPGGGRTAGTCQACE